MNKIILTGLLTFTANALLAQHPLIGTCIQEDQ